MTRRTFEEATTITDEAAQILDLVEYSPTTSNELATPLVGILGDLERSAYSNIAGQVAIEEYTQTELQAMVTVEALRLTSGLDLMAVIARAKYLRTIQEGNMIANHPGDFHSLGELAAHVGMSMTQISQTLDLVNIVFPFVQNELEMPIAQLWEDVGKSKLVEILPVLKVLITGEASDTRSTQAAADNMLEDTTATWRSARADEMEAMNEEELDRTLRHAAAEQVIELGTLPTREMRRQMRPERTAQIQATVLQQNGTHLVVSEMDNAQFELFRRQLDRHMEEHTLELPADPRQRQIEAARVPELRRLLRMLEAGDA